MICRELICAEHILVDDRTKRVSAINILDDTKVGAFPIFWQVSIFISLQKIEGDDADLEVFLQAKLDESILFKNRVIFDFASSPVAKAIVFAGVPMSTSGTLVFSIIENKVGIHSKELKSISIKIEGQYQIIEMPVVSPEQ